MKFLTISAVVLILTFSLFSHSALADNDSSDFYNFIQSQFKNLPGSSLGSNSSSSDSNFVIEIGTVYDVEPGSIIYLPVTLNYSPYDMYGFDFLMNFDNSIMQFVDVEEGPLFYADGYCEWEYFNYRYYDSSSYCGPNYCPNGAIRVVGIAETNVCCHHPLCFNPNTVADFFTLKFSISENIDSTCAFVPVEFIWYDCGDNAISFNDPEGPQFNQKLAAAKGVYSSSQLIQPTDTFPSLSGPADTCYKDSNSNYPLLPLINFYNGGVYIKCDESQFSVGDIDLDGFPYSVHDVALFASFFYRGVSAFKINPNKQIAATDINKDGQSLKLEDLIQFARIRVEGLDPDSTNDITIYGDNYIVNDRDTKSIYLDTETQIPVLWLKFFGEITPENENLDYIFNSDYDGVYTRVIVAAYGAVDSGSLFLFDYEGKGDLVGSQASNLWGHEISTYYFNCGFGRNCRITLDMGDINLNGLSCEIADWVIFSNYFLNGEQVFTKDPNKQIYNTDVNLDSIFLTIEDFVFMSTHLIGGPSCAVDFDTTSSNIATFQQNNSSQMISVNTVDSLGAVWLIFDGEVTPAIIDTNFHVVHNFDNGQTKMLIYPRKLRPADSIFISPGPLISYSGSGQLVEAHTATNMGAKVNSVIDISTDIADNPDNLPTEFALYNNYPNPFNIETTIKFDLPRASEVSFEIINILGQLVYNVTNRYSAGSHTIYWDGSSNLGQTVGSGVYYYRITAGDFVSSKKMILLK